MKKKNSAFEKKTTLRMKENNSAYEKRHFLSVLLLRYNKKRYQIKLKDKLS